MRASKLHVLGLVIVWPLAGCENEVLAPVIDAGVALPDASSVCGDRLLTADELCDGTGFRGYTCATFGYSSGELTCTSTCGLSLAACSGRCGDGIVDGVEECDDGVNDGAYAGCFPGCRARAARCGDRKINGEERCDGEQLGNASCLTEGFDVGRLHCDSSCAFDTSGCRHARALSDAPVVFISASEGDGAAGSIAAAGDLDDDGFADLLIGAPGVGLVVHGAVYVIFGNARLAGRVALADVGTTVRGLRIDDTGNSAAGAGLASADLNGDGVLDLAIGAPFYQNSPDDCAEGAVFIFYGPLRGNTTLASADVAILGAGDDCAAHPPGTGITLFSPGDADHDGFDELLIAAPCALVDRIFGDCTGSVYVMRGRAGWRGVHSVLEADRLLWGARGDGFGTAIRSAGDVDGDGELDLIFGANDGRRAYLVYGPVVQTLDVGLEATVYSGVAHRHRLPGASAGDLDGDGRSEYFVSSEPPVADDASRLISGSSERVVRLPDLHDPRATFVRPSSSPRGIGAGDLDQDGTPDLALADVYESRDAIFGVGAVYFFRGSASLVGSIDLSLADAKWIGTSTASGAGTDLVPAGDVNGDGFVDLLIANEVPAPFDDHPDREAAYLIFGAHDVF